MEKNNKKKFLIGALAVLLVAVAVGGTIAWLNAQSNLTNSFTVGQIEDPTTDPENPENPLPEGAVIDGNLYEPNWSNNSKLVPGDPVAKDPMVGLGKGSEDAYVFIYVDNNAAKENEAATAPYFTLNTGWAAVTGEAAESTAQSGAYTSGLFVYGTADNPTLLQANAEKDVWTTDSAFDTVTPPSTINADAFAETPTIEVYSYVVAADSGANALADAKAWAGTLVQP